MMALSPFPKHVTIDVHNYCDAKCSYCPYERLAADPNYAQGEMEPGLFLLLLDQCQENLAHLESMRFGNIAESLVLPRIWWAMECAISRELPLYIDSNMTRMDAAALDRLEAIGFTGKVFAHVQPDMGVDFQNQWTNYAEALTRWGPDRVELVQIDRPRKWAGDKTIPQRNAKRCTANRPYDTMIIGFDGVVQLCCVDVDRKRTVGSVAHATMAKIWAGASFEKARRDLEKGWNTLCNKCEWGEAV